MSNPKPISLTQVSVQAYEGPQPQKFLVVGAIPGGGGGGGGAVESVNGKDGEVVLTPADIGAAAAEDVSQFIEIAQDALTDLATDVATKATQSSVDAISQAQITLAGNLDSTHDTAVEALNAAAAAQSTANGRATVASVTAAQSAADAAQTSANSKAPLASPAFTGTPTGITKAHVGLPNVDNTSDTNKPVSSAQQAALDLKLDKSASAALNTVGWDRAVYIANGGVVPANTPAFTVIRELA